MAKRWNPGQLDGSVKLREDRLDLPLRTRKPTVFACQISYGDLFHEAVPDEFIDDVLRAAIECAAMGKPHRFAFITKRWSNAADFLSERGRGLEHIILLASVWDQGSTDAACAAFAGLPIRWGLHCEPMLDWIDLSAVPAWRRTGVKPSWVVVGGETGPKARPMHPDWVRTIRDQCEAAGVPFWFKSWGEWVHVDQMSDECHSRVDTAHNLAGHGQEIWRVGKKHAGRLLDGIEHNGVPWERGE
jgi:protein gp37